MEKNSLIKYILILILYITPFLFITILPIIQLVATYMAITFCIIILRIGNVLGFFGNVDYARGKNEQASAFFKLAILKDVKNPTVYLNYANLLIIQKNFGDAFTHLKTASILNIDENMNKDILLKMAICNWEIGHTYESLKILQNVISKYPNKEDLLQRLL